MTPLSTAFSRRLLGLFVAAALCLPALFAGSEAQAQYQLCNRSSYGLKAAMGYVEGNATVTRGWWQLRAGECKRVLSDQVSPGRYFVYAEAMPGHRGALRTWSGRLPLCVQEDSIFNLRDQTVCADDPRRRRAFFAVDVEGNADGTWMTEIYDEQNFTSFAAEVAGVQRLLSDLGLYDGAIDGALGAGTRTALSRYATSKGFSSGTSINDTVMDALIEDANRAEQTLGFTLCNSTMLPIWAAFAQPTGEDGNYTSSGWWWLEGQDCAKVRRGDVGGADFYVYATMEADTRSVPLAGGDTEFCVAKNQFEADGGTACFENGYEAANFARVSVDDGATSMTFEFTPELFNPDIQR